MSKKHFIALAAEFSKIKDATARKQAAEAVCTVAAQVNDRFDRSRFLTACGVSA
jgi:hypothetical protein